MKFLAISTFFLAAAVQAEEPERAGTAKFEKAYNDLRAATIGSGLTETEQALYIEMMEGRDVSSCGCTNNDPHVYTYDGVHSECQGKGDFIYSMSETTDFMVQARFSIEGTWSNWNAFTRERSDERFFGTATKGAVVNTGYPNEPKVEAFAGTRINSGNRNDVSNCEMQWYFDDVKIDDMAKLGGHDGHGIYDLGWGIFWRSGKKRYIFFRESGLWMEYDKWAWNKWGCAVNVCVCPSEKIRKTGLIGILGTADGNKNNEYTKRDGSPLPTKAQGGFDNRDPKMIWEHNQYCREQWCLGDDDIDNIFKTPINNCDGDPSHKLDVAIEGASEELKELCLYNQECIMDAIVSNDAGLGVRTLEEIKEQHEHKVDPNRHCEDNQEADECLGLKFERYTGNKKCKDLGFDLGFKMGSCNNNKSGDFLEKLSMSGTKVGATCDATTSPGSFEIECGEKGSNNKYKDFKVTPSVDTVVKVRGQMAGNGGLYYKELKAGVEYTLTDGGAEFIKDIEFCFMCDQLPDPPCPNENKECPDGTILNRLAPSCDFAECPPCPADQMECPDGTMLDRDFGNSCNFAECPPCDDDTFTCPNGDVLTRDASNCEFPLCGPCDELTKACPGGEVLEVNVDTCDFADCPTPDAEPEISTRAFTKGDPHFMTFGGEMYDFHGECDLVLLHNPQFKNGLGMDIHIRTKISDWWSSVETAAVKIGDDILEITGAGSKFVWINGKENEDMEEGVFYKSTMAGYLVRYRIKGAVREAHIHFGSKDRQEKLVIKAYKEFVRVDVDYEGSDSYVGSVGLLGSRDLDGVRVGRDMKTVIQNHNEFGQEWQVREDEPKLFHSNEGAVQAPNKCILPVTTAATKELRKRRLAESDLTMDAIEVACGHLTSPAERKGCVDDVVATQDMDMAAVW